MNKELMKIMKGKIKINGCFDCPFLSRDDHEDGVTYDCNLEKAIFDISLRDGKQVEEKADFGFMGEDLPEGFPKNCPFEKIKQITVQTC